MPHENNKKALAFLVVASLRMTKHSNLCSTTTESFLSTSPTEITQQALHKVSLTCNIVFGVIFLSCMLLTNCCWFEFTERVAQLITFQPTLYFP